MNLFVYGTLAPGESNAHILEPLCGDWKKGTVKGQLFQSGWGAALGFPGIVLNSSGDDIKGLLFCSSELESHWKRLDDFEGEGYQRVITSVFMEDGNVEEAYIYELSETGRK